MTYRRTQKRSSSHNQSGSEANFLNRSSNVIVETVTVTAGGVSATGTGTGTGTATATSGLPEPSSLTSFTVPEPYYIDSLADPGCQKSRIDVQYGERYDLSCGLDIGSGRTDVDDSSKTVADIVGIFAYSLTDCLYACANVNHFTEYNKQNVVGGVMQSCKSVTWNYNMAASNTSDYANCWLKNGTSSGTQCNNCISGTLVWSGMLIRGKLNIRLEFGSWLFSDEPFPERAMNSTHAWHDQIQNSTVLFRSYFTHLLLPLGAHVGIFPGISEISRLFGRANAMITRAGSSKISFCWTLPKVDDTELTTSGMLHRCPSCRAICFCWQSLVVSLSQQFIIGFVAESDKQPYRIDGGSNLEREVMIQARR